VSDKDEVLEPAWAWRELVDAARQFREIAESLPDQKVRARALLIADMLDAEIDELLRTS